ncbi:MAG: HigA family addiction module antitoxin [Sphingomicrobium sp.]
MPTTERNKHIEHSEFLMDLYPPHPGQLLKVEVLPARKVTGTALAHAIGATQPSIAKVLNGKGPITPALAARIEAAVGYPAAILCRLQTAYDLAEVRRDNSERLKAIPRIAA